MKIWIDADACPRVIKDMIFRASERLKVPVCLVANNDLSRAHTALVTSVRVKDGFDVADDCIAEPARACDLVITADIPLAARIVEKGGVALDPRGELYTEDSSVVGLLSGSYDRERRKSRLVIPALSSLTTCTNRRVLHFPANCLCIEASGRVMWSE